MDPVPFKEKGAAAVTRVTVFQECPDPSGPGCLREEMENAHDSPFPLTCTCTHT